MCTERGGVRCDAHGHIQGLLDRIPGASARPRAPDTPLSALGACGLDLAVVCAVGDPASFGVESANTLASVLGQLRQIEEACGAAGMRIVKSAADLAGCGNAAATRITGDCAVVLGVEGADFLCGDFPGGGSGGLSPEGAAALDILYEAGVRVFGPMHYSPNALGSIGMDLAGRTPGSPGSRGLTPAGADFVRRANALGILVDVAHAHDETVLDIARISTSPLICSHSLPRGDSGSPRLISDDAARVVAGTGGLVGLWPARFAGHFLTDLPGFADCARRAEAMLGAGALALGTDFNGNPGYIEGYAGPAGNAVLERALEEAGMGEAAIAGMMGANLLRLLAEVLR